MDREIREKLIELARNKTPWSYSQLNEQCYRKTNMSGFRQIRMY